MWAWCKTLRLRLTSSSLAPDNDSDDTDNDDDNGYTDDHGDLLLPSRFNIRVLGSVSVLDETSRTHYEMCPSFQCIV